MSFSASCPSPPPFAPLTSLRTVHRVETFDRRPTFQRRTKVLWRLQQHFEIGLPHISYRNPNRVQRRQGIVSPLLASGFATNTDCSASTHSYPHISQESQTRRLADLAFMIGDYKLAAAVYDQASKDYKTDRAWRYYSSACVSFLSLSFLLYKGFFTDLFMNQRMAGLSLLMLHPPNSPLTFNPDNALESALQVPPSSGIDFDGLKAMMLYYEVYRSIGDWRAAPAGLVRTAGEVRPLSTEPFAPRTDDCGSFLSRRKLFLASCWSRRRSRTCTSPIPPGESLASTWPWRRRGTRRAAS